MFGMLAPVRGLLHPRSGVALVREALRNLNAFRGAYAWLFRELLAFSRRRVVLVAALNLLGVVLQWIVVGAVLIFVGKLTGEGGAFQAPLLGGVDLPVEASFTVVSLWAVVVLLLVAAASASAYGAEAVGFETAMRYVNRSGRDILGRTLASRSRLTEELETPSRQLQLLLSRDQLMVMRAMLIIQRALRSVLMVFVAAIVLALINPGLSAVVGAVAMLFVIPYYLINRRMVGAAAALQERSASAGASISRLVEHATSREPNKEMVLVVPELYPSDAAIAERWSVLRDIMLGAQRTSALMSGLVGTSLVAVVVTFGLILAQDETSWVAALTFVIGLNFASGAFIQLASLVTAASRFLPHVQGYIAFGQKYTPQAGGAPTRPTGPLPILRAPHPELRGSEKALELRPGLRALCVWSGKLDRLNVHHLLRELVDGDPVDTQRLREGAFFYGDPSSLPPISLGNLLGGHGSSRMAQLGLLAEVQELPHGEATVLTPRVQEHLSPLLRYALGVLEGVQSDLLVLGWKSFARLDPGERGRLAEVISAKPVLFMTDAAPAKPPAYVTHVVVLGGRGIAGMGDTGWYKKIAAELQTRPPASEPVPAAGLGLDELADA